MMTMKLFDVEFDVYIKMWICSVKIGMWSDFMRMWRNQGT